MKTGYKKAKSKNAQVICNAILQGFRDSLIEINKKKQSGLFHDP